MIMLMSMEMRKIFDFSSFLLSSTTKPWFLRQGKKGGKFCTSKKSSSKRKWERDSISFSPTTDLIPIFFILKILYLFIIQVANLLDSKILSRKMCKWEKKSFSTFNDEPKRVDSTFFLENSTLALLRRQLLILIIIEKRQIPLASRSSFSCSKILNSC